MSTAYPGAWVRHGLILRPTITRIPEGPDGPEPTTRKCIDCGGPRSRGGSYRCWDCYVATLRPAHDPAAPRRLGPTPDDWTEDDARAAHNAYNQGARDPWTVEGERAYNRLRKRAARARKQAA